MVNHTHTEDGIDIAEYLGPSLTEYRKAFDTFVNRVGLMVDHREGDLRKIFPLSDARDRDDMVNMIVSAVQEGMIR